jgi:hypothetical protein
MIVEFIGCAGAGKTTLSRMICERGIAGNRVVGMPDLLLDRAPLRRIRHATAVNIVQEVCGFPFFLGAWRRERGFIAFAGRMLIRHAPSTFDKLNGIRGIVRKVGMYQLARSRASDRIILSDEGTVLTAYNVFVMTNVHFGRPELEQFARLVPLPDMIVYVRAPVASLVERATSRPDPRRQHVGKDAVEVERDIRRTVDLFDLVVTTASLRDRVVVVENGDSDPAQRQRLVAEIAARLRALVSAGDALEGASPQRRTDHVRSEART